MDRIDPFSITLYFSVFGAETVAIREIEQITFGQRTKVFQKALKKDSTIGLHAQHSVSLSWESRSLDLVFANGRAWSNFTVLICKLASRRKKERQIEAAVKDALADLGLYNRPQLTYLDVTSILEHMRLRPSNRVISLFGKMDRLNSGVIEANAIYDILKRMHARVELEHTLWSEYAGPSVVEMDCNQFQRFLRKVQKQYMMIAGVQRLMKKYHPVGRETLTVRGFAEYLHSHDNYCFNPLDTYITDEMNHPINHYFINSSSHTFLEKDQLLGDASAFQLLNLLKSGVRFVELDLIDGPDGNPCVKKAFNFSSSLSLEDILSVICAYGFVASVYPLFVSLRVDCNNNTQIRLTQLLKKYLGDYVADKSLFVGQHTLPSPKTLKYKVILKGSILSKETYQELVHFFHFHNYKGTDQVQKLPNPPLDPTITSFSENKAKKVSTADMVRYTKDHLASVHPSSLRLDSSNFNPLQYWIKGFQFAALNLQTVDENCLINQAWFSANAMTGYRLKPTRHRAKEYNFDPISNQVNPIEMRLKVTVLDGRNLFGAFNPSQVKPYVEVRMTSGYDPDCNAFRTKEVKDNSYDPIFNESFSFNIAFHKLAVLSLTVYDQKTIQNQRIGYFALPLTCIRSGYRIMPLYSSPNKRILLADLMCHFSIN